MAKAKQSSGPKMSVADRLKRLETQKKKLELRQEIEKKRAELKAIK